MARRGFWGLFKRGKRYAETAAHMKFDEKADPKIQLEQAIREAQEQHQRLTNQAANVIANQRQAEMRLSRAMDELEKANRSARQAVMMADEATKNGATAKAAQYAQAAESFANRLITLEAEVESLKTMSLQAASASDQAKAAVAQNSMAMQKKLSEKQKLLSQLDQAQMAETLNAARASIADTLDDDVPSLDEVRNKIEARFAKAIGTSELTGQSVEAQMLEVEQATMHNEAQARLAQIRGELGMGEVPGSASGTTATPTN
jgi:phage shock protein A